MSMTTAMDGRRVFGAAAMLLVLAGCGGSDPTIDNANQGCSVTEQKSWLRGYMRDWYYWTGSSPDPDPADYASVADLFKDELFEGSGAVPWLFGLRAPYYRFLGRRRGL